MTIEIREKIKYIDRNGINTHWQAIDFPKGSIMFRALKRTIYAYTAGYQDYREEIQEFSARIQLKYSEHLWQFLLVYTTCMIIVDAVFWKAFYPETLYGLLLSAIAFINWLVFRLNIVQKRNEVMMGSNIFLFLFLQVLEISYDLANGYVSQTILICIIISTAIIGMNPLHYFWIILAALVTDISLDFLVLDLPPKELIYYFVDSIAIMIIAMEINLLLSRMRYQQFREKVILKRESSTDVLTGLFNRKYFEWFFRHHYQNDQMCAVIHLDLDNFKLCNDTFGHQTGDDMLCRTADILKNSFRQIDCVARVGGDEFMIFMNGLSENQDAMEKIGKILEQFPFIYENGEKRVEVSVSIGLAFSRPGDNLTYEEMYYNADSAMYKAKKAGKGRAVVFGEKGEE